MARGPRAYGSGVEKALYRLASGTCYFPDCPRRIIEVVEGEPVVAVDIAHIFGANPGSARYHPDMTDDERRAFDNLILLCTPHHKVIDGPRRGEYPPELLQAWKRANEPADGIAALSAAGLTDEVLDSVMEQIAAKFGPKREAEVDLGPGLVISSTDVAAIGDLAAMKQILGLNPHLNSQPKVLVANIRNTGTLAVSVEAVDLWVVIADADGGSFPFSLMGRNDFGSSNPPLPYRLEDGDAVRWLTKLETIAGLVQAARANGFGVLGVRAAVRLGTGETVESELMDWVDLA